MSLKFFSKLLRLQHLKFPNPDSVGVENSFLELTRFSEYKISFLILEKRNSSESAFRNFERETVSNDFDESGNGEISSLKFNASPKIQKFDQSQ